ncbi:response regulator transcription factor [Paenibacillus taichungensis]|uniref:Response regulator transcription factor n=1 Tax=Paenibacillus taichungensis TaxID=484184 RepID=A0ABX2MRR7_9BACL|nr:MULTISPECIES: response regulator transcription factor [Paenibacillus]OME83505.1 DNA-binding response regulator [Paenibacillus pabuli]MCZ1268797.1 DNA-binding response regulator [Paenibacillus tundrae]MDR9745882.1 response regulator transcription factor [Paenibacillus taichungensis]MEC0107526.1 response regulator transcription factor [Paenibacillus taichungensis]MEC0195721.1 response regulator transcription factor [Paenibacillus taichungensis]
MSMYHTILVVDDDQSIVELLRDFLENDQFHVKTACDTEQAWAILQQHSIDCIVLDIMMPGQNGFELCRRIRGDSNVPILFLSARSDDVDKIRGLTLGGDDYIVKTASPGEIVARVKAVLRRTTSRQPMERKILDYGRIQLNLTAREVLVEGGKVELTPKEYELLRLFAEHPRQVFSYEQLLAKFWEGVGDRHTIRVHLSRLREKIESDPNHPQFLINVWGVGYRFEGV